MLSIGIELACRGDLHDMAKVEHHHAITEVFDNIQIV
jgi:hypothetical protein